VYTNTHEELAELVGREYRKATDAYTAIKSMAAPTFTPPSAPVYTKDNGSGTQVPLQVIWTRNFIKAQGYDTSTNPSFTRITCDECYPVGEERYPFQWKADPSHRYPVFLHYQLHC